MDSFVSVDFRRRVSLGDTHRKEGDLLLGSLIVVVCD